TAASPALPSFPTRRSSDLRPRLTAEVADVGDLDAGLFLDLAGDGLLQRLADLDEPGERREERQREPRVTSEQGAAIALDQRDDRSEEHTSELQSRSDLVCR